MTDEQARIISYLTATCKAMTAHQLGEHIGATSEHTFDLLRDLEDMGQVCGGESGFYRVPNTLRKRGMKFEERGRATGTRS